MASGKQTFGVATREFLDELKRMNEAERVIALDTEPRAIGDFEDAYLGALAEELAKRSHLMPPPWSEQPSRFLRRAWFASDLESLKAILLAESPASFRRRQLFVSANALERA